MILCFLSNSSRGMFKASQTFPMVLFAGISFFFFFFFLFFCSNQQNGNLEFLPIVSIIVLFIHVIPCSEITQKPHPHITSYQTCYFTQRMQQIICWLGGHCGKVPLFFSPFLRTVCASIDHCLRKRVCDSNAVIRIWAAFANPCASVGVGIDFGYQIGSFLSWAVINI